MLFILSNPGRSVQAISIKIPRIWYNMAKNTDKNVKNFDICHIRKEIVK